MNVSKVKKNELHDWIDTEVPQMVESRIEEQDDNAAIDEEVLKVIEKEITKLLKQYFK